MNNIMPPTPFPISGTPPAPTPSFGGAPPIGRMPPGIPPMPSGIPPMGRQMPNPRQRPTPPKDGFRNFVNNTNFIQKIHNPNYPTPGTGTHVPMWLSPKLAQSVLAQHGQTGHAIPHQNLDLDDLTQ